MARSAAPIYWLPLQQASSPATSKGTWQDNKTRRPDGTVERLPLLCHMGDNYEDREQHPRAQARYVMIVRHEGHTVPLLMTNGAADLTRGTYAQYMAGKARKFGWYLLHVPLCRQIKSGDVRKDKIVCRELLASKKLCPAKHYPEGCPCSVRERAARQAAHVANEAARDSVFASLATKHEATLANAAAKGVGAEMRAAIRELVGELKGGK
jgi:hypothetical protein